MEISCVKGVEQNPLPKSQTKPFYIGTKEAPSVYAEWACHILATFGVLPMVKSVNLPMVLLVPFLPMVTRKP